MQHPCIGAVFQRPARAQRGAVERIFRDGDGQTGLFAQQTIDAAEMHDSVRIAQGPFYLSGLWWKAETAWALEIWHVELSNGATYQLTRTAKGWCVEGVLD